MLGDEIPIYLKEAWVCFLKGHAQLFCLLMLSVPLLHWTSALKGSSEVQVYHIQPWKYCWVSPRRDKGKEPWLGPCPPLSSNNLVAGSQPRLQPRTHATTCEHSRGVAPAQHRQSSKRCDSLRSKQVDTQFSALSRVHRQTPCSARTAHQPENTHARHLPFRGFYQWIQ